MEVTYEVVLEVPSWDKPLVQRFSVRQEALDEWDRVCDNVLPGEKAKLYTCTHDERLLSSSFAPCDRNRDFPS